jgi:hypothetical protein
MPGMDRLYRMYQDKGLTILAINMQESALLFALQFVARNREVFLENFYLKSKRSIERGRAQAPYAWIIPAAQRRKGEAAGTHPKMRQGYSRSPRPAG